MLGGGVSEVLLGAFHGTTPYLFCGISYGLRLIQRPTLLDRGLALLVGRSKKSLSLLALNPEQVTTNTENMIDLQIKAKGK